MTDQLALAMRALSGDSWRHGVPFSADIKQVHDVLTNPFVTDANREAVLSLWIQRFQPCLFGKAAAARGRIHYCFLTRADLGRGTDWIREKITRERRRWKIRALDPASSGAPPAHSFVVHVGAEEIIYATPDSALRSLALLVRELWGCAAQTDPEGNDVANETLYLKRPDGEYFRFIVNLDFFAVQGDGRWWHDHRIPGGFAFTANATGHMARYREWYDGQSEQDAWGLNTAMRTIAGAHRTEDGVATALLELPPGGPVVPLACPFDLHDRVKGFDWTRYRGYYDTDHSVRDEFFSPQVARNSRSDDWLQDFTYLFHKGTPGYLQLMGGEHVTLEQVVAELGAPDSWRRRPSTVGPGWLQRLRFGAVRRRDPRRAKLLEDLSRCESWAVTDGELANLEGRVSPST